MNKLCGGESVVQNESARLPVAAGFLQKWTSAVGCVRQVASPKGPSNAVRKVQEKHITTAQFASKRPSPFCDPHHAFCVMLKKGRDVLDPQTTARF